MRNVFPLLSTPSFSPAQCTVPLHPTSLQSYPRVTHSGSAHGHMHGCYFLITLHFSTPSLVALMRNVFTLLSTPFSAQHTASDSSAPTLLCKEYALGVTRFTCAQLHTHMHACYFPISAFQRAMSRGADAQCVYAVKYAAYSPAHCKIAWHPTALYSQYPGD